MGARSVAEGGAWSAVFMVWRLAERAGEGDEGGEGLGGSGIAGSEEGGRAFGRGGGTNADDLNENPLWPLPAAWRILGKTWHQKMRNLSENWLVSESCGVRVAPCLWW